MYHMESKSGAHSSVGVTAVKRAHGYHGAMFQEITGMQSVIL